MPDLQKHKPEEREAQLRVIEMTLAYEQAASVIDGECLSVDMAEEGSEVEAVWLDLGDLDGEVDLHDAVTYLDSRRLLYRHAQYPNLVQVCDETEPLPEPISERREILCTPVGLQTPEGIERVNKAVDAHTDAAVYVANVASAFCGKWAVELDGRFVADASFNVDLAELEEVVEARNAAQDEMLRAVSGHPKAVA